MGRGGSGPGPTCRRLLKRKRRGGEASRLGESDKCTRRTFQNLGRNQLSQHSSDYTRYHFDSKLRMLSPKDRGTAISRGHLALPAFSWASFSSIPTRIAAATPAMPSPAPGQSVSGMVSTGKQPRRQSTFKDAPVIVNSILARPDAGRKDGCENDLASRLVPRRLATSWELGRTIRCLGPRRLAALLGLDRAIKGLTRVGSLS